MRGIGGGVHNGSRTRSIVGAQAVIQAGTTGKLHSSFNIASYTDNGAGDHTLTFAVPFATLNSYVALVEAVTSTNALGSWIDESNPPAAGSVRVLTINAGNALVDVDPTLVICIGRR